MYIVASAMVDTFLWSVVGLTVSLYAEDESKIQQKA